MECLPYVAGVPAGFATSLEFEYYSVYVFVGAYSNINKGEVCEHGVCIFLWLGAVCDVGLLSVVCWLKGLCGGDFCDGFVLGLRGGVGGCFCGSHCCWFRAGNE